MRVPPGDQEMGSRLRLRQRHGLRIDIREKPQLVAFVTAKIHREEDAGSFRIVGKGTDRLRHVRDLPRRFPIRGWIASAQMV